MTLFVGMSASPELLRAPHAQRQTLVRRILDSGIDHMFVADHVSFRVGTGMDGLVNAATLAALALRHPIVVARQIATLSEAAPGQLILGVGVGGEDRNEFTMCGVDPRTRGRRTRRTVWRRVAGGMVFAGFAAALETVRENAKQRAAPPSLHGLQLWAGVDDDQSRARERLAKAMYNFYRIPFERFERYSPFGTAQDIAAYLAPFREGGCRLFNVTAIDECEEATIEAVAEIKRLLAIAAP